MATAALHGSGASHNSAGRIVDGLVDSLGVAGPGAVGLGAGRVDAGGLPSGGGGDGEAQEGDAGNRMDIDRLFREAHAHCRRHDRDRANQSLSKAMLEFQAVIAEEKLQAAQLRNAEFARRARLSEQALSSRRSHYAERLRSDFSGINAGYGGQLVEEGEDATAIGASSSQPSVQGSRGAAVGSAAEPPWLEEPGSALRRFETRLPRTRKRLLRNEICQALQSIGIEHAESLFDEPPCTLPPVAVVVKQPVPRKCSADEEDIPKSRSHTCASVLHTLSATSEQPTGFAPPDPGTSAAPSFPAWDADGIASWARKATLNSHLDAVRCVVFGDGGEAVLSCGEDAVVKAWDLNFMRCDSSGQEQDLELCEDREAFATFRGHRSAVLSLAHSPGEPRLFSGGQDGVICAWHLPNPGQYDPYGASPVGTPSAVSCRRRLRAHRDAVWSLCLHPEHGLLASASADKTIRLWRPHHENDAALQYVDEVLRAAPQDSSSCSEGSSMSRPTSVAWVPHAAGLLMAGFASDSCGLFDAESGSLVRIFSVPCKDDNSSPSADQVLSVGCHPSMDIAFAAHLRCQAHLFSISAGRVVHVLRGHEAAVTSVAFNPIRSYEVVTGCHDGLLRIFDIRGTSGGSCLRQVRLHDRKYGEAIHSVAHSGHRIATGGADSNLVILDLVE